MSFLHWPTDLGYYQAIAYFIIKEVNPSLAKPPQNFSGGLAQIDWKQATNDIV